MSKSKTIKKLVLCAILVSIQIILSRYLGIQTQLFQISLGFVPVAIAAMLLGPVWAVAVAFIADFVGTMIGGTGAYNPMFSINAVLYALIYAFFFYKKNKSVIRIILCVFTELVLVTIPLTPLWLYIYLNYVVGSPRAFEVIFSTKLIAALVEAPIKVIVLVPVCKYLYPNLEKIIGTNKNKGTENNVLL